MNINITKFLEFLENYKNDLSNEELFLSSVNFINNQQKQYDEVVNEMIIVQNLIRILSLDQKFWPQTRELFNDFEILCKYLNKAGLDVRGKMDVLFYMIEKNIATGILKENVVLVDSRKTKDYKFDNFTSDEVRDMIFQHELHKLNNEDKQSIISKLSVDVSDLARNHLLIYKHYINRKDNYTEEDINYLVSALLNLKVDSTLCDSIYYVLMKKLEKRKKTGQKVTISFGLEESKKEKEILSRREYKLLVKEINAYYDLDKQKLMSPLTWKDAIYCASLLYKIQVNPEVVRTFFTKVEKFSYEHFTNPIALYNMYFSRLKYYREKYYFDSNDESFANLEDLIQEIFIANEEDYIFWKESIGQELHTILSLLPQDFEYEEKEVEKLLKK